jgi:hypothetical protein
VGKSDLDESAAAAGRGRRTSGGIDRLVIGRVDLYPQRVFAAHDIIRKHCRLHDVDNGAARCRHRLLAFYCEVDLTGNHDEHRGRVGMQSRPELPARLRRVVGRVLLGIQDDLFGPVVLAGMHAL